ncbi:hypothetical protein M406DRAFT_70796 [Cryphonectria parasitica EP155]|uniref:Uncharacterized protein n=1 Tax=Cryphonectria parasitica (strain ATCC 38755 / EP155) TaxID=660469 RepID=A0A9P4Y0D5_CRYP1|nr:uncharacterized protein M406DRAFT_70796 [Cryphonectria parasitica EP155]KAF3764679.1 hypothetical protein M406DRAFT_70796 [Cryphonectria parasitica EP155]
MSRHSTSSGPPSPLLQQPSQPMGNLDLQGVSSNAISSPAHNTDHLAEDEKTSSRTSRFVGNMLVSRIGRASWQSLESTARLPFYLSPWGDNHPFTLPNLRKRDLALAGVAHFGLDALGASAVTVVESAMAHAVSATVEQTADEGLSKVTGKMSKGHLVQRRVGMNSLTLRIRHKLIGEAAELVFQGVRDTDDRMACAKGWFCPYLYASGREPEIARAKDFAMAQLLTPRLAADASIAPTLLSSLVESDTPVVSPFGCSWEDASFKPGFSFPKFKRMAIFLTGISPYRYITTQSAWSHSRIPNEARITFHLFTHVPAIVLPVRDQSPIMAWSPWTVAQMLEKKSRYDIRKHVGELLDFIGTVIDEDAAQSSLGSSEHGWRDIMEGCLHSMLSAVLNVPDAIRETAKECCELERTGVVAFRY